MDPQPLAWVFANYLFQDGMQTLRIPRWIAGHFSRWIEAQNVAVFVFEPQRESWDHDGASAMGDLRESGVRAGRGAKEIDEDSFFERCVLIHQDTDRFVLVQRAQDGARSVPLLDQPVAGKLAA